MRALGVVMIILIIFVIGMFAYTSHNVSQLRFKIMGECERTELVAVTGSSVGFIYDCSKQGEK